jgi:SARP family transcriptional regulator, regulator of embCAB operon
VGPALNAPVDDGGLRISICGQLTVAAGDVVIREEQLPGRQGRRLWAYLVLERRRPLGRDELATAVWGDEIPDAWDSSLNALASRIRAALRSAAERAPELRLRGSPRQYALELPADAFVDRERAWSAIHHVQALSKGGDLRGAFTESLIAAEIAGRGFLPGEDGEWVEAERRMLRDLEAQALDALAEAELASGRALEAERVARRLLARDPLRESGYRMLMRALAANGNAAQALRVIDECRRVLREVAGTVPSAETERVYAALAGPRPASLDRDRPI